MDLIGAIAAMGIIVVVLWIGTAIYLRIKEGYWCRSSCCTFNNFLNAYKARIPASLVLLINQNLITLLWKRKLQLTFVDAKVRLISADSKELRRFFIELLRRKGGFATKRAYRVESCRKRKKIWRFQMFFLTLHLH